MGIKNVSLDLFFFVKIRTLGWQWMREDMSLLSFLTPSLTWAGFEILIFGQDFLPRRRLAGSARRGGGGHSGGGHVEVALAIPHLREVGLDLEYQTRRHNNVMPSSQNWSIFEKIRY